MANIFDKLCLTLMLIGPIFIIFKFKKWTLPIASCWFWIIGIIPGIGLSFLDPERNSIIDHTWFIIGLPAGFIYSFPFWGIKYFLTQRKKRIQFTSSFVEETQ